MTQEYNEVNTKTTNSTQTQRIYEKTIQITQQRWNEPKEKLKNRELQTEQTTRTNPKNSHKAQIIQTNQKIKETK